MQRGARGAVDAITLPPSALHAANHFGLTTSPTTSTQSRPAKLATTAAHAAWELGQGWVRAKRTAAANFATSASTRAGDAAGSMRTRSER